MSKTQTLRGFRDFYPPDMAFQKWLYSKIQKVSEKFGFEEYNGPIVEPLELYAAKSGEELVKKQSYVINTKDDSEIVLRPEMTPSLARMVANKENDLVFPIKWFTYGPRFRYEKPQRGRGREFCQWDIDILGNDSVLADAEIISIAASFYMELGLSPKEVVIKINDREFMYESLKKIGVEESKIKNVFRVIDKKEKVSDSDFSSMLNELGIKGETITKIARFLEDKEGYKNSKWLSSLFEYLKSFGVLEYVVFDPTIVRGLDYYTRTVFEGWDVKGEFRSIWGGGRYDNLTKDVGSRNAIPGVGFAMGNMVIEEILKDNRKYPQLETLTSKILVTVFSENFLPQSIKLVNSLRSANINAELYENENTKLDKQLKYANKKGISYVAVIGEDEVKSGKITLKNMQTGKQEKLSTTETIKKLK